MPRAKSACRVILASGLPKRLLPFGKLLSRMKSPWLRSSLLCQSRPGRSIYCRHGKAAETDARNRRRKIARVGRDFHFSQSLNGGGNTARPELALSGRRCCRWCRWPEVGMDGIRQFIAAEVFASGSAHLRHSYERFAVVVPSIPKQESNPALFLRG